jgi:Ca2+-binding RTX toxin-like protein
VFSGGGGNGVVDQYYVGAQATVPLHQFHGAAAATDIINVVHNIFTNETALDLRNATMESIDGLRLESGSTVTLKSSQFGIGLSSSLVVEQVGTGADASMLVQMDNNALDLRGLTVSGAINVLVNGTALADTIFGTAAADIINGGAGIDVVDGSGGADVFGVAATEAEFDSINGGSGSDAVNVTGAAALVLSGFNAASQSIEVWQGNGQGLLGNGNANALNLAGLTAISGLAFIDGGAGNDAITGSQFADLVRGGLGTDTMTGGLEGDRFEFTSAIEIGKKPGLRDIITDFARGEDLIDLSAIDANGLKKGNTAFKFLKKEGAKFTDKAGQLAWDQKKAVTIVQGDIDGNGKVDFRLELTGVVDLAKGDFVL